MALIQEVTNAAVVEGKPDKPLSKELVRHLGFLFTVGWYVALSLAIPTGIGYWLDRPEMFNRRPLFTLIGFGLGTVIAFYGLYAMLRRFQRTQKGEGDGKGGKPE